MAATRQKKAKAAPNATPATGDRRLPKPLSFEGKTVVVTGAANGIGRATAKVAAELGASLLLVDRAPLAEIAAEIKATGAKAETLEGDLTAAGFIERMIAKGPIDAMAHCAGILGRTPLHKAPSPAERFHQTMDVNVRVPIDLGMALIEHMAPRGGGSIVMIGSVAGRTGGTSLSTPVDYSASKGAVHVVVRWLSRQGVGRGVLINGVAPGPVKTGMTAGSTIDPKALPRGSMGTPEEIAWMIMMLLSPAASYVSGAVLDVNGGSYVG